ncbi:uncharacterized protein B0T23DRAFT_305699 [Neurospora hispaniola]|uniref:Uncharacterized protein n=1 Tax=Neurospora hispaniola TaxID=588809 RepID=A0AAJ0IE98_9PEZI|nr:hypothetical protein B0T23DRAFT_305699 [Neurospora hispaniola]
MADNQQQQKPIYVATYGRDPKMAAAVSEKMLPDVEVVHTSLSLSTALHELPALFSGDTSIVPSSGLGSNTNRSPSERHIPTALLVGGSSLSDEEYENIVSAVREAIPGAEGSGTTVQFIRIGKRDFIGRGLLGRGLRGFFGAGAGDGVDGCAAEDQEEGEGRGGIGGRFGDGDSAAGNDIGRDTKGGGKGNRNGKRFWQRDRSADSGIGLPDDDDSSETPQVTNDDFLGTAIATGTSTSFAFAGSTGWRYISLSDDDNNQRPHANQDETVGLLQGMRFRGKKKKGKKVVMFASGIPEEEEEHEDDDADGKKKGVKGKGGKCEGWFETLMVHGFGSIAHFYVPCVDFTTFDENGMVSREVVAMPRQRQAHIVVFDDGLGGIALRDL